MHGEIVTTGNELTSGSVQDQNAWYAAGRLTAAGFQVVRITFVGDDFEMLSETLTRALERSRFVIVTGGLGATSDDITNEIAARALNRPLCLDRQMFDRIKSHARKRGMEMTPPLEKMAWTPEGSRMLNPEGSSCGFYLVENRIPLYFLPGVPEEMRNLMDKFVLPDLQERFREAPVMRRRVLKLYGLTEPEIAQRLDDLSGRTGNVLLGFYPRFPENHITLSLRGDDARSVADELSRVEEEIRRRVGGYVFAMGKDTMESVVGRLLSEKALTLCVAESCTGGFIGHRLTNVAGSSRYFTGGVIVYSNSAKTALLGVRPGTLRAHGAVSDETAREMAQGARGVHGADMALAVTGIAGPDGGSREKPVGTVHLALAAGREVFSGKYRFRGTRDQVKQNASTMALDYIRRYLNGDPFLPGI